METLNFPEYRLKIQGEGKNLQVWDLVRKKYVSLTPEEWVRQHMVLFLINEKKVPSSLIRIESGLVVHNQFRRTDIVAYSSEGRPLLIVECKATSVKLNQDVFDQAARYNIALHVPILIVTNGKKHYCCHIDFKNNKYAFLKGIPDYQEMKSL